MKGLLISAAVLFAVGIGSAEAKGCLKGALVGGTVGHFAGHHGVFGAAAGCVIAARLSRTERWRRSGQI